jgi:hypothetical protein
VQTQQGTADTGDEMTALVRMTDVSRGRAVASIVAVLAVGIALAATPPPAGAASPCGKQVAEDWSDNGRIDGIYKLRCYQEGIDALPQEIRDYTNAEDVIRQAYLSVGGGDRSSPPPSNTPDDADDQPPPQLAPAVDTSSTTSVPVPVFVLGALALVLLGAGALSYATRRRARGEDEPPQAV